MELPSDFSTFVIQDKVAPVLFSYLLQLISSRVHQCGSHELSHTTAKELLGPAKNFGSTTNLDLLSRVISTLFIYKKLSTKHSLMKSYL